MSEPPFHIRPLIFPPLVGRELQELRGRVADGIFLGGDFQDAYDSYLVAHRDRQRLLELVDDLSVTVHAARLRSEEGGDELLGDSVEVVSAADFDAVVDDAARFAMRREKDAEGMGITLEDAQSIVAWMEIADDEDIGPEPWAFLKRLRLAFPTLVVHKDFHKREPMVSPPKPAGCSCSMPFGKHTGTCLHFDYPEERQ
jgi:hypothetical protein